MNPGKELSLNAAFPRVDRPLNLFYADPDPDRWVPFDRYPRRWLRTLLRGRPRPRGQQRVFLNLLAGLDRLKVPYRVNDFRHARRHPRELVGVIGKPFLLRAHAWRNPILFGSAVFSHPSDAPRLFDEFPVRHVLVPGAWFREMYLTGYPADRVSVWPTGLDTDYWSPPPQRQPTFDVLIYDKLYWDRADHEQNLLGPLRATLDRRGLAHRTVRYGAYEMEDFHAALGECRAMIFLSPSETQGFAYQEALARGVPVLAWESGGEWRDPAYWPRIRFGPVASVPYWDDRCGVKFTSAADFPTRLDELLQGLADQRFQPRQYILEHLTLEACAAEYVRLYQRFTEQ